MSFPFGAAYFEPPTAPAGVEHWRFLPDLSDTEYHGDRAVPSSTVLKPFLESAAHGAYHMAFGGADSDSKQFGRLCHMAVYEPARFEGAYAPEPDVNDSSITLRTAENLRERIRGHGVTPKGAKKDDLIVQLLCLEPDAGSLIPEVVLDGAHREAAGRELIPWKDWVRILGVRDAVRRSDWCMRFLAGAWLESSCYWVDPEFGVSLKCRPDAWRSDLRMIKDLKVTNNLAERALMRTIDEFDYDLSAALYLKGTGARQFVWVFVSDRPDILVDGEVAHSLKIRHATRDGWLHTGAEKLERALRCYSQAINTNEWPCWEDRAEPIYPPFGRNK